MPLVIECNHCHKSYEVPDAYAGNLVRCLHCGEEFNVPKKKPVDAPESPDRDERRRRRREHPDKPIEAAISTAAESTTSDTEPSEDEEKPAQRVKVKVKVRVKAETVRPRLPWLKMALTSAAAVVLISMVFYFSMSLFTWRIGRFPEAGFEIKTPARMTEVAQLNPSNHKESRIFSTPSSRSEQFTLVQKQVAAEDQKLHPSLILLDNHVQQLTRADSSMKYQYRRHIRRGEWDGIELFGDWYHQEKLIGRVISHSYFAAGKLWTLTMQGSEVKEDIERNQAFFESLVIADEPKFAGEVRYAGPKRLFQPQIVEEKCLLQFTRRLPEFYAGAFIPAQRLFLALRKNGDVTSYSWPEWEIQGEFRLDRPGYRCLVDPLNHRLFVLTQDQFPKESIEPIHRRMLINGDVDVYDLRAFTDKTKKQETVNSLWKIAGTGAAAKAELSIDGKFLYILDVQKPEKPEINVIDVFGRVVVKKFAVSPQIEGMCRFQNLNKLALIRSFCGHSDSHSEKKARMEGELEIFDPQSGVVEKRISIPGDPFDIISIGEKQLLISPGSSSTSPLLLAHSTSNGDYCFEIMNTIPSRCYLTEIPAAKRFVLSTTLITPPGMSIWNCSYLFEKHHIFEMGGVQTSEKDKLAGGDVFISPDGRHIVNRYGSIYRLIDSSNNP